MIQPESTKQFIGSVHINDEAKSYSLLLVPLSMPEKMFLRIYVPILLWIVPSFASRGCDALSKFGMELNQQEFSSVDFDYIVVGGGTAGLALASRLSEDANIQVGVIEAGIFHKDDPLLDIPANIGRAAGNPAYDWNFVTTPQPGLVGRSLAAPRGKLLGGSSALNFLAWNRAPQAEYDSWESFAPGSGWNWQGMLPFFKKSMSVFINQTNPFAASNNPLDGFNPQDIGFRGPIQSSFNSLYPDPVPIYAKTINAMGIETNANPDNGTITGLTNSRSNIDRVAGIRSYSAPAYHCPAASRKNYRVLMGAQATRVLFKRGSRGNIEATGVEFSVESRLYVVNAKKEVILSSGAYKTPQLLELSGIGNKTLLEQLGIKALVDLPSVGENLQDHFSVAVQYQLKPGFLTLDELTKNATFASEQALLYNTTRTGWLAASNSILTFLPLQRFIDKNATDSLLVLFDRAARGVKSPLQSKQNTIHCEWIEKGSVPQMELLLFSNSFGPTSLNHRFITVLAAGLHHIGRGSVHINTTAAFSPPVINPNWLSNDYDLALMQEGLEFVLRVGKTAPLIDIVDSRVLPAPDADSEAELISHIRRTGSNSQHPMGTAAMGPRNLGGVLDGELRVYGTSNLRVCDASVIPISVGAHLQSTVYAIAEKLAHDIRAGRK